MSQVLYVADVARILGKSEAAIRAAHNRAAGWLPKASKLGGRLAWNRAAIESLIPAAGGKVARS